MIPFYLDGDDIFLSHLRQRVLEEVFVHVGLELETQNDHIKAFEIHFSHSFFRNTQKTFENTKKKK